MVIEFVGLPGSGKSIYCARLAEKVIGSSLNDGLFMKIDFYKLKKVCVFYSLLRYVFFDFKSVSVSRLWKLSSLMVRFTKDRNGVFLSDQGIVQCIISVSPKDYNLSLRLLDFVYNRYPYMVPTIAILINVDAHTALNRVLLRGDLDKTYFHGCSVSDIDIINPAVI